jgi:tRNA threonylcarbamoyladenosine biosynthesis protein TsaE
VEKVYITESAEETKEIAQEFAKELKNGDFIAFYGDLGSGKTTFIQGIAKELGIERRIISPTFIIIRTYVLKSGKFYHIDLYRTENEADLIGLGIEEILNDKNSIVALEWAEKMGGLLPEKRIEINCRYLDDKKREIKIKKKWITI